MDFGDLIILLFLVFPVIGRILANLKKRGAAPKSEGAPEEKDSFFDRAIREIESALEEASSESRPDPSILEPQPTTRATRKRSSTTFEDETVRMGEFHSQEPGSFESRGYTEFHELTPVKINLDLLSGFETKRRHRQGAQMSKRVQDKLLDKTSVQDAFIMSEILGPRRGSRRGTR